MARESLTFRIRELDPDMIAPSTKNMNKPDQGGSKIVIIGKPGCFIAGTKVLMYNGELRNVEDVRLHELVMGDDNTPRRVLELCRGRENMYKIQHTTDGEPYTVNETHKLVLKKDKEIVEITVKEYLEQPEEWKRDCKIYRVSPEFEERQTLFFPYEYGKFISRTKQSCIPIEFKINTKKVRNELLRGFFEENGPVYDHLEQSLVSDIDFIRKSVGSYYEQYDSEFTVSFVSYDFYYGFTLDGNHRFLLGSFDVVRNTGKTTLITSLLYEKSHIFPIGVVMSGTEDSNGHYGKIFPSSFVFNALDKEKIEDMVKRQKIAKQHLPNPWAILLLDDCTDDPKLFNDPLFQGIFKNGRHWKMLFILSLQYSLDIKPVIRTNVDGTFILRETNLKNRKSLWENYAGVFPDFGMFCDVLDQLTDDYTSLYVHNATTSNKIEDCVFWYKAKPIPEEFRIGCQDYWDYHEERFDKDRQE
jgi:hypothetical protein